MAFADAKALVAKTSKPYPKTATNTAGAMPFWS